MKEKNDSFTEINKKNPPRKRKMPSRFLDDQLPGVQSNSELSDTNLEKTHSKAHRISTSSHKKIKTSHYVNPFPKKLKHFPRVCNLSSADSIKEFATSQNRQFIKSKDTYSNVQNLFVLSVCSTLKKDQKNHSIGVFAKEAIWVLPRTKKIIGRYLGELIDNAEPDEKSSFVMMLPNGKHIDAAKKCNFLAFVNCALSKHMSNCRMQAVDNGRGEYFVEYYFDGGEYGLYIPAGSQILVYYGSTKEYNDFKDDKKFLTSRDSPFTTRQLYAINNQHNAYKLEPEGLDVGLLKIFKIPLDSLFAAPQQSHFTDCFDIPYLQLKPKCIDLSQNSFLKQNSQENITPLMVACWHGNLEDIERLLNNGANPSLPSTNFGYTAFHVTMFAKISNDLKKQIITLLCESRNGIPPIDNTGKTITDIVKHGLTVANNELKWFCQGDLTAQDLHERTIAHIAIEQNNACMLDFILEKSPLFWDCLNIKNDDILELAITKGNLEILNCLLKHIMLLKKKHKDIYLKLKTYQFGREPEQTRCRMDAALEEVRRLKCPKENFEEIQSICKLIKRVMNNNLKTNPFQQLSFFENSSDNPQSLDNCANRIKKG